MGAVWRASGCSHAMAPGQAQAPRLLVAGAGPAVGPVAELQLLHRCFRQLPVEVDPGVVSRGENGLRLVAAWPHAATSPRFYA